MTDNNSGKRPAERAATPAVKGGRRTLSDADIDRVSSSLVATPPSPRLHANVMRRLGEKPSRSAGGWAWRFAPAAAALLVFAAAAWFGFGLIDTGEGPAPRQQVTGPSAGDAASAPTPSNLAQGPPRNERLTPGGAPRVAVARPASRIPRTAVRPGAEATAGEAATTAEESGLETVNLLLDVAPVDVPPLSPPAPPPITPVQVELIQIPEIVLSPVGDPADSKPDQQPPAGPKQDEKRAPNPPSRVDRGESR